jgi:hypothetical protein
MSGGLGDFKASSAFRIAHSSSQSWKLARVIAV